MRFILVFMRPHRLGGIEQRPWTPAFSKGQWALVRTLADGLVWSCGSKEPATRRLRFILDVCCATGLRATGPVRATLRSVQTDSPNDHWLALMDKGSKAGVHLPKSVVKH